MAQSKVLGLWEWNEVRVEVPDLSVAPRFPDQAFENKDIHRRNAFLVFWEVWSNLDHTT